MGMAVVGRAPTSERGEHFGNNIHWWHPLAAFCQHVAPEITSGCKYWHTNDGDGLDTNAARELADALAAAIDSGEAVELERKWHAEFEALPKKTCSCCKGGRLVWRTREQPTTDPLFPGVIPSSFTTDPDDPMIDDPSPHPCPDCGGEGIVRVVSMIARNVHPFSVENVQAFAAFLRDCGGFEIW
jgi:hypothetical protein